MGHHCPVMSFIILEQSKDSMSPGAQITGCEYGVTR